MTDLPSDRLTRRWARGALYTLGVLCLTGATIAMMDGKASMAAAGAALGVAWVIAARLMAPH